MEAQCIQGLGTKVDDHPKARVTCPHPTRLGRGQPKWELSVNMLQCGSYGFLANRTLLDHSAAGGIPPGRVWVSVLVERSPDVTRLHSRTGSRYLDHRHSLTVDCGRLTIHSSGPAFTPLLIHMPPLEWEGAIDSPNIAFHKLIFISRYRDNSILRDEVAGD